MGSGSNKNWVAAESLILEAFIRASSQDECFRIFRALQKRLRQDSPQSLI